MVTTVASTTGTYNMKSTAVATVTNAKLNKLKLQLAQANQHSHNTERLFKKCSTRGVM